MTYIKCITFISNKATTNDRFSLFFIPGKNQKSSPDKQVPLQWVVINMSKVLIKG